MAGHVFISYSRTNRTYVEKLVDFLTTHGIPVWFDKQIEFSASWERVIFQAIEDCTAFIVVMSPEAYAGAWVLRECQYAEECKKVAFPVLLDGKNFPRYVGTQFVDCRGGQLPPMSFIATIKQILAETPLSDIAVQPTPHISYPVQNLISNPFEWVFIPKGQVFIEDARLGYVEPGSSGGIHEVSDFMMSKYPITNHQYQHFVAAEDGYYSPQWWKFSTDAYSYWQQYKAPPSLLEVGGERLPCTNVNWYEAIAFCLWLSQKTGLAINLPTEAQWQRAAQGNDKRVYPWGNTFLASACNSGDSHLNQPTPVDAYPLGVSPYQVWDLVGNVWEWCLTQWGTEDNRINTRGLRVLRGGCWTNRSDDPQYNMIRCGFRNCHFPVKKANEWGFRIALNSW